MADMPGDFWSGWIVVLTLVSAGVIGWLVWSVYFSPSPHRPEEEVKEPVWDGDLEEGSAPAPMWWFWLILGATVFSVAYLMLYPGLGSFSGMLQWSQDARVQDAYANYNDRFNMDRQAIADADLSDLQADAGLMETANRIFQRECAACHGRDGRGQISLFPNLMDVAWQWGGSPEQIEQSIRGGRQANMMAWAPMLETETMEQLTEYVIALGNEDVEGHPGASAYEQNCASCHGPDGGGNSGLGAPALSDSTWLYGGDHDAVMESIAAGRNGVMPAFADRLDDAQIHLLVAWLAR